MDANQAGSTPNIYISSASLIRLDDLRAEFNSILLGKVEGEPDTAVEKAQLAFAQQLVPSGDAIMALIVSRLVTHFVRDPQQLIAIMNERHFEAVANYRWILPATEELLREEQALGAIEGQSLYWLSQAQNVYLQNQEAVLRPAYAPAMFSNRWQYLAIRSLLRLQAILFDMSKIDLIATLHAMHWEGRDMTPGYTPEIPKREGGDEALQSEDLPTAKPALN